MIIDGSAIGSGCRLQTDVCIIGAGPAGITVAHGLRGSGLDVCLLESGALDGSLSADGLTAGENVDDAYYALARTRARGFGGTSRRWAPGRGVRIRPLDCLDFDSRPDIGRGGWPFSYEELLPHYRRVHEQIGLGDFDYDVARWCDGVDSSLGLSSDRVGTVLFRFAPLARFRRYEQAFREARALRVLLNTTALDIDAGGASQRASVTAAADDARFEVVARKVVIAAGGIDSARLLLLSRHQHPGGLGNEHDLVGRHFMEHPHIRTGAVRLRLPPSAQSLSYFNLHRTPRGSGILKLRLPDEVLRRHGLLGSAWWARLLPLAATGEAGEVLHELRELAVRRRIVGGTGARLRWAATHPRDTAGAILAGVRPRNVVGGAVIDLAVMAEQLPNPQSRVTLGTQRDRLGQPVARVDWQLSAADLESISRSQQLLAAAFDKAGLGRLHTPMSDRDPRPLVGGGFHHMGTARMHRSPREGVTDPWCRLHAAPNIYIASSAVMPSAGYANPTLTILALADRVAATIRRDAGARAEISA